MSLFNPKIPKRTELLHKKLDSENWIGFLIRPKNDFLLKKFGLCFWIRFWIGFWIGSNKNWIGPNKNWIGSLIVFWAAPNNNWIDFRHTKTSLLPFHRFQFFGMLGSSKNLAALFL